MTLHSLSEQAANAGRDIDLTGCDYGPHKRTNQFFGVAPYYYFLAGFVRTLELRRILEIGTSYGGSMMALNRGFTSDHPGIEMVTVDKADLAGEGIKSHRQIKRVHGDSLAPTTLREVALHLSPPIDLLYIDSKHDYDHTSRNLATYGAQFQPRFVILDDIHLNTEMDRLWSDLALRYGEHAFDASELAGRPSGFGILDYRAAKV